MEWFIKAVQQFSDFEGRARRREYWFFVLFYILFALAAMGIDDLLGTGMMLYTFYVLALFPPALAVQVRRLHDTGKSGWMILIAFIPVIGYLWLLFLLVQDSTPGENAYGPNPKEPAGQQDQNT
ncbi:MAG: DUF805 domain-containing protein [Fibrobacterota bacterium]